MQPGLSITPNDIEQMTVLGRAVASHSIDQYNYSDGVQSPSDLPLPYRRGVSQNDSWEMMKRFDRKMNELKRDKSLAVADKSYKEALAAASAKS